MTGDQLLARRLLRRAKDATADERERLFRRAAALVGRGEARKLWRRLVEE